MEFIETLKLENGKILNYEYHLQRIQKTFEHFKWKNCIKSFILEKKSARVRITYNQKEIIKIEYFPLKERLFKKFKLENINFNYSFKYKNRKNFEKMKQKYKNFDEIILVKNSLITDTTISNIAFFTGNEWITPKYPLLKGTKREELINKKILKEENIHISDLKYFKKMALINAILGFYEIDDYDIIR